MRSVLEVKPTREGGVTRLGVGQEGGVVEETADCAVRVGGGNGRGSSLIGGVKEHMSVPVDKRK